MDGVLYGMEGVSFTLMYIVRSSDERHLKLMSSVSHLWKRRLIRD